PAKKDGKLFKHGILRHIVIRKAFKTDEVMVILVTTNKKIPYVNELIDSLNSNNNSIKSIVQNINDKDTNLVMGEK
ncbi:23S rRNA (Uracil-5-)-methyltransferase RumA, partial [human gut metagenome]